MLPRTGPTRSDVTLQLARGLELVRRHRWANAVVALTSALELDPQEPRALEHRARCFLMLGRMHEALGDAERLVQVDKKRNAAYVEKVSQQQSAQEALFRDAQQAKKRRKQEEEDAESEMRGGGGRKSPSPFKDGGGDDHGGGGGGGVPSPAQLLEQSPATQKMLAAGGKLAAAARAAIALARTRASSPGDPFFAAKRRVDFNNDDGADLDDHGSSDDDDEDDEAAQLARARRRSRAAAARRDVTQRLGSAATGSSAQRGKNQLLRQKIMAAARADVSGQHGGGDHHHDDDDDDDDDMMSPKKPGSPSSIHRSRNAPQQQNLQQQQQQQQPSSLHYYVGILLRAQVLFAMGRFEEACRQFHEGQRERPELDDFATGVAECEHILLGAVHPWRRRHEQASSELTSLLASPATSRPTSPMGSRPTSAKNRVDGKAAAGTTTSSSSRTTTPRPMSRSEKKMKEGQQQQQQDSPSPGSKQRSWRPPQQQRSYADKEIKRSMPELADDFFFLRNLRQHPRIFSTGLGPGIARDHHHPVTRQITRQLQSVRGAGGGGINHKRGFFVAGGIGDQAADLTNARFGGVSATGTAHSKNHSLPLGADKVPGLFGEPPFAGPSQLAAISTALAVETAEEELALRQDAELLAHAEAQAEKAARSQRGTPAVVGGGGGAGSSSSTGAVGGRKPPAAAGGGAASTGDHFSPSSASPAASASASPTTHHAHPHPHQTTSGLGMFGSGGGDDDDDKKRRRRDFHVRPPDSKSWGVQSARGRRRMTSGIDTTLQYLELQQRFWMHRDERTTVPALDEPDLPPRFRPEFQQQQKQRSREIQQELTATALAVQERNAAKEREEQEIMTMGFSASARNVSNNNRRQSTVTSNGMGGGGAASSSRRRTLLRHPTRPVATASADFERRNSEVARSSRRRSSMASIALVQRDIEEAAAYIDRRQSIAPSFVVSSEGGDGYNFLGDDEEHALVKHFHGTVKDIAPEIACNNSSSEGKFVDDMHLVFRLMADQHNTRLEDESDPASALLYHGQHHGGKHHHRYGNYKKGGGKDGRESPPQITSDSYTFCQRGGGDDVSGCVLAVPSSDAAVGAPPPVFASANLRSVHRDIQLALSKGTVEVVDDGEEDADGGGAEGGDKKKSDNSKNKSGGGVFGPGGLADLARIQRALFDGGDDPYLIASPSANQQQRGGKRTPASSNRRMSPSPQRAITLRWGEYDGLHFGDAAQDDDGGGSSPKSASSPKDDINNKHVDSPEEMAARRHRARQHARHQRARGLLAQNIRQELGVELPYEAVFRVPIKRRDAAGSPPPTAAAATTTTTTTTTTFQPRRPPSSTAATSASTRRIITRTQRNKNNTINNTRSVSPAWFRDGREYATVSVRGSPPGKTWAVKPEAIGKAEGSRLEEIAKAAERKRREEEGGGDDGDDGEKQEEEPIYDDEGNVIGTRPVSRSSKRSKSKSRSPDHEGGDDAHQQQHDDNVSSSAASSAEPLTLDQVRAMYSKSARQKLKRQASSLSGGGGGGGGGSPSSLMRRARSGIGFADPSRSGGVSQMASDSDTDTETDSDDDDFFDDEDDIMEVDGVGEPGEQQQRRAAGSGGGGGSSSEAAGIAEAISAAKALLDERNRAQQQGALFQGWSVNNQSSSSPSASPLDGTFGATATFPSLSATSPNKNETAAMKRLNATLRNISRLCALGDVPQAIAIAAALVKELEAVDPSLPALAANAKGGRQSPQQQAKSSRRHNHHQNDENADPLFASPFLVLASKLRCTLGGLYLDIGEGSAAVSELSRAVLLAKKAQQQGAAGGAEVYEQAVTLLGECYQTSGEDVAEQFEVGTTQQKRRGRAASVVRS